jgi:hypothetical protein
MIPFRDTAALDLLDVAFPPNAERAEPRLTQCLQSPVSPPGLGTWEADLRVGRLDWSYSTSRILGLEGATPSLRRFLRIVHPGDRALVRSAIRGSLKKHTPLQIEHRIVLPGGLIRYVRHSADYKLDRRGNPVWLRGVL